MNCACLRMNIEGTKCSSTNRGGSAPLTKSRCRSSSAIVTRSLAMKTSAAILARLARSFVSTRIPWAFAYSAVAPPPKNPSTNVACGHCCCGMCWLMALKIIGQRLRLPPKYGIKALNRLHMDAPTVTVERTT